MLFIRWPASVVPRQHRPKRPEVETESISPPTTSGLALLEILIVTLRGSGAGFRKHICFLSSLPWRVALFPFGRPSTRSVSIYLDRSPPTTRGEMGVRPSYFPEEHDLLVGFVRSIVRGSLRRWWTVATVFDDSVVIPEDTTVIL